MKKKVKIPLLLLLKQLCGFKHLGFHNTQWSVFLLQDRNHKDTLGCVKQTAEDFCHLGDVLIQEISLMFNLVWYCIVIGHIILSLY